MFICILSIALGVGVADDPAQLPAGHSVHGVAFNEGPRGRAYLMGGTGAVRFPSSTIDPLAQQFIDQGVGQLHGFWYWEAERSFRQAAALDDRCAIAYWGMARANRENRSRAQAFSEQALARKGDAGPIEIRYIDALHNFLTSSKDDKERGADYIRALERIVLDYPDELEAKALLVLELWGHRDRGLPITSYLAVDGLIGQVLAREPMHPIHHYRIHLWDKEDPQQALRSAALCGPAAPAIAHMWHMPGHTYSHLHRYADAAWQQEASARVDHAHMIRDQLLPDQIHNYAHNQEWWIRNLIHSGRVREGISRAKDLCDLPHHPKYNTVDKENSSAHFGRVRLIDALTAGQLWPELIGLSQTHYLAPTDSPREQVRRLRALGRAYFRSADGVRGNEVLRDLESRLVALNQESPMPSAPAETPAPIPPPSPPPASAPAQVAAQVSGSDAPPVDAAAAPPPAKEGDAVTAATNLADSVQKYNSGDAAANGALREAIEKGIAELQLYAQMPTGSSECLLAALAKATDLDLDYALQVELHAGKGDLARERAAKSVLDHPGESLPLASQVWVLWRTSGKDAARAAFTQLRNGSESIELDLPIFARLAPLAIELGWPTDWRLPRAPVEDLGVRPDLESLGPIRWQPPQARPWQLPAADGGNRALADGAGKTRVLIFYLGSGCVHCVEQLRLFETQGKAFTDAGISLLAISSSVPSAPSADPQPTVVGPAGPWSFPIVTDPTLRVFRQYRAYDDFERRPLHGTFIVDGADRIRWHDIGHEPFMDWQFVLREAQRPPASVP